MGMSGAASRSAARHRADGPHELVTVARGDDDTAPNLWARVARLAAVALPVTPRLRERDALRARLLDKVRDGRMAGFDLHVRHCGRLAFALNLDAERRGVQRVGMIEM